MKFVAVDLGASSGRTIVGDIAPGHIELEESHRFDNQMTDVDGEKHWDIEPLVMEVRTGIRQAGDDIQGIGIDTWGVDFGLLSFDEKLLGQPFAYRDARHATAMPEVYERISKERLYEISGLQEMGFNSIFQIMAEKIRRPEILEEAAQLLFIPELLVWKLTGIAATEYTIASTSGMLDAETRDWSDEVIEALDLPRHMFGAIEHPGATVGAYHDIPVCLPAMHDTGSAVVAVPAVDGGNWAYLSSGTWSLIGAELDEPILTAAARDANFTNEGGVDGKIRFLKNVNGLWLIQECRRMWAEQGQLLTFAQIAGAAELTSDFDATIDPNDPCFLAPDNMLEAITQYCRQTAQQQPETTGEFARCCYVSLAKAYRREMDKLASVTGKRYERLHVVGGGAQAELLNQLTADHCEMPVYAGPAEATAIGNLCMLAKANGVFSSLDEIRQTIAEAFPVKIYQPGDGKSASIF